jgi:MarR family transcriptional regulator, temperature-dependent positive regulator of motility|tara:strand:- start:98 stop:466 length:369 start_codon:yes stop_codon:yes gene_type:complete
LNNIKKNNQDYLEILIKISKKSEISQRKLAQELGFSLGKLNYCIKELHKKGLIKIQNFNKNKKKSNYLYFLTPQGLSSKTKLTMDFMKKKLKEYDELKFEIDDKDITEYKKQPIKKIDHNLL